MLNIPHIPPLLTTPLLASAQEITALSETCKVFPDFRPHVCPPPSVCSRNFGLLIEVVWCEWDKGQPIGLAWPVSCPLFLDSSSVTWQHGWCSHFLQAFAQMSRLSAVKMATWVPSPALPHPFLSSTLSFVYSRQALKHVSLGLSGGELSEDREIGLFCSLTCPHPHNNAQHRAELRKCLWNQWMNKWMNRPGEWS